MRSKTWIKATVFAQLFKKEVSPERLDALTAITFLVTKFQDIRDISRMILSQVVW